MGVITPPVEVGVYAMQGIAKDLPSEIIFNGILPFPIAVIVTTILMIFVPSFSPIIPHGVMEGERRWLGEA